jgi:Family of unknown function (DUF5996)
MIPDIRVAGWAATKRSLHLYAQMLGKIRLALSPPQPNWMNTPLYLTARGLTTGAIACKLSALEVMIDVYDSSISLAHSDGESRRIPLLPVRTVAEVYADLGAALETLRVDCFVSPTPQEIPDTTPLNADRRPSEYDPAAVQRWFHAFTATASIFERWRSRFFGRSGIQVWWGSLDVALILFNGKHVPAPTDRGYLMKYDLDAELMNVGLYLGDQTTAPFFFGYIYPQPDGAEHLPMRPAEASWSTQLREWVLPYEAVRASRDSEAALTAFIDAIYELCFDAAGWDRAALAYKAPNRGA